MGTGGKGVSTKVVRQSPGLKIAATGNKIERISKKLKHPEKLEAILKELSKKKKSPAITVSDASFSAYLSGSVYSCSVDFPDLTGDKEFWLVNTLTWVYTYASASSTSYATFNVNKPLLPGTYRVYAEDSNSGTQYSNEITLGDGYTGVSINSGILSFTNVSAYTALKTRLKGAYNAHQTYIDTYDSWTDNDAVEAQLVSDGFDEFLPYKEFEAYFGFSSLRAEIRSEVEYWQSQYNYDGTNYPEDSYIPYSYEQQTLMNAEGQVEVGGVGEGPMTLPIVAGGKIPSNPGPSTCMDKADMAEHRDFASAKKVKMYVFIDPVEIAGGNNTVFSGRTRTMKRIAGFWFDEKQRQQIKVYGSQYLACSLETTFDSGLKNTENYRRYMMDVDYSAGSGRQGKSGQVTTAVTLTDWTMTPYELTYTH